MVVDGDKEVGAVARTFGVNEEYLGRAVWFMKENRQREADELLQRAAGEVVGGGKEVGAVARTFGVNEEHLRQAVWFMKRNRQGEPDEVLQRAAREVVNDGKEVRTVARIFGVNEEHLRRAVAEKRKRDEEIARQASINFGRYMMENPPS
jgi:transposase-like protein